LYMVIRWIDFLLHIIYHYDYRIHLGQPAHLFAFLKPVHVGTDSASHKMPELGSKAFEGVSAKEEAKSLGTNHREL